MSLKNQSLRESRSTAAVLAFEPSDDCPFVSTACDIVEAQNSIVDEDCHCEYVVDDECQGDGGVTHVTRNHHDDCACHVFNEYDCVPNILSIEDNTVVVKVYLPDPAVAYDLVTDLKAVSDRVALRKLTNHVQNEGTNISEIDLGKLTDKQRFALELAVEKGYYDRPRNVSLAEMVEDLDISKQAFAQRLQVAERKTFNQLIDP